MRHCSFTRMPYWPRLPASFSKRLPGGIRRSLMLSGVDENELVRDAYASCRTCLSRSSLRGSGTRQKAFTMATYVHSQPEALSTAAKSFARVVTNGDNSR